jgi:hypothetical protein
VTVAMVALCVVVALGLAVKVLEMPRWGVERYTISTRDFPNVAAELTPKIDTKITPERSALATPPPPAAEAA